MKIVVAQHNGKFMTWAPVELWFFHHLYYMNFNKAVWRRESFRHVVLDNLKSGPWIVLIAGTSFSLETDLQSKLQTIKPIVSVNKEGYDCLVIWNNSLHFKVNNLSDQESFMVGSVALWFRVWLVTIRCEVRPMSGRIYIIDPL